MEDKELKVMASSVRAAARKCSTANGILRTMFPEAFEKLKFRKGQLFLCRDDEVWILARTGMTQSINPTWRLINIFTGGKHQEKNLKGQTIGPTGNPNSEEWFEADSEDEFVGYVPISVDKRIIIETTAEGNVFALFESIDR
jgi:hypothetical protein